MQRNYFKKLMVGGALLASLGLVAGCGEEGKKINEINPEEVADIFESAEYSVDEKNLEITLPEAVDSLVVGSLSTLGGAKYFVATDDDPVDPSFDWDNELTEGSVIKFADTNMVRIVVLDDKDRTIAVWTISYPVEEKSSSSVDADVSSSSKYEDEESSSSEETVESSSSETVDESSSSVEPVEESSSSEIIPSSSSEETVESSSSEEIVESSSSEEVVESSSSEEIVVSSSSEEVVVESSSSEIVVPSSSSEVVESSSSEVVPESSSSEEIVVSSSSEQVEPESSSSEYVGAQLPGSHFDSWDKTFWGSTSDAMAKSKTVAAIKIESAANAEFAGSKLTLTTREIVGSFLLNGSWKMAGGFYFAGSFANTDIVHLYQWNYTSGTPDASYASDISLGMTFGQPFSERPVSFDVTYSYEHVANSNSTYPQQGLIYVILVSANNEIVAAGSIVKTASSEFATERVDLQYGSDAGLLGKGYAGINDLELGTGEEEVASIRVMFASSAYAFVVDGGTLGNSGKYRGGKGSQLTIDEFKLNY
ncbi:MAG: PCMD domain-containing protein [Fibrobacter sp.]|nr:PCMD domain-containing protein [Fibrobacter sp.]